MFYKKELSFLRDVFEKCRIKTEIVGKDDAFLEPSAPDFTEKFGKLPLYKHGEEKSSDWICRDTVYKLRDSLGLCFVFFILPDEAGDSILLIGPYHDKTPSVTKLLELGEKNRISPKRQKYFEEFLLSIPEISDGDPLFLMIDRFCEIIWKSPSFAIVDVNNQESASVLPINDLLGDDGIDDVMINLRALEMRYAFENQMIRAVSQGQLQMESQLSDAFSEQMFEKRVPDLLRNTKNYGIIMNTLLRKAAEEGGVHPMYVDRISSDFAVRIENLASPSENGALMLEMFRSYCRLVRKHAFSNLSPAVQKTLLVIDSDLSAPLSPSLLAEKQNVSLGYLCTIFKKEMGKTISEYVREKRMKHAIHLLSTTNLQIQTVALHCGIVDVQYFSKIFKRHMGRTPKEYRACELAHLSAKKTKE